MPHSGPVVALIVAAGRGLRAGDGAPKQYRRLAGKPVLTHAARAFAEHSSVDHVLVVIHPDDRPDCDAALAGLPKALAPAIGGANRQASVRLGLEALAAMSPAPAFVLVHDAARPFVSAALIDRAIAAARDGGGVPAVPVVDTIREVENSVSIATPDRARLVAIQTPQAFPFSGLLAAHRAAFAAGVETLSDDGAVMERAGHRLRIFEGEVGNVKLTHPQDFAAAEARLSRPMIPRIGFGYDVHAFGPGDHVMIGGVRIAHVAGVLAHSDGDVVLHALTDAILGALGDGDIGVHFPPSDMRWRGAPSEVFLADAAARVRDRGGRIVHLDATLVAEAPRVGPHRAAIVERIATIAGLRSSAVSIKATTSETLGFTGRREGLAAQAVATLLLPEETDGR